MFVYRESLLLTDEVEKKVLIKIDIIFTSLLESYRLTTYITCINNNYYKNYKL